MFNWFTRQHDQSDPQTKKDLADTESADDVTSSADSSPPEPSAEATSSETTSGPQADNLAWAKLAYENIRKRQQEAANATLQAEETTPASTASAPTPEASTSDPAPVDADAIKAQTNAHQIVERVSDPQAPDSPVADPQTVIPASGDRALNDRDASAPISVVASDSVTSLPDATPGTISDSMRDESPEEPEETAEVTSPVVAQTAASAVPEAEIPETTIPEESPAVASTSLPSDDPDPSPVSMPEPATMAMETTDPRISAPAVIVNDPPEEAIPFWMQADAEREAKLERLRSTAIELEEAPPRQPSAPVVAEPVEEIIPEVTFDDGFLWSAEVLAAQGRRAEDISLEEITWLKQLRQGLDRTRRSLINQLRSIVGQGPLNQEAVESIEDVLLQADVGVAATDRIIQALQQKLRSDVLPPDQALTYLKQLLRELLEEPLAKAPSKIITPDQSILNIWLITGVNGVGKTTTIGKLAHIATKSGYQCLIAAADTFRAAAVEQVKVWGQRSNVEVIANPGKNTDPAAVVYDAIAAAQSRGTELLLVDTAGRLQNKKNLMDELSKIRRIIDKKAPDARIESFLVLDASLGQNGVRQAEVFMEAAQLNGVILTKLDGTAKGGVAFAIVQQLGLPIRFIGAGEGIEDLRPFSSYEFVEALLSG